MESQATEGSPPHKRLKSDYKNALTVIVGEEERSFVVHKAHICAKSPFFENAEQGFWANAKKTMIRFPETQPEVFETYIHWVYCSEIILNIVPDTAVRSLGISFGVLSKLWILGDMLLDNEFCNQLSDRMLERHSLSGQKPSRTAIQQVFKRTAPGSNLRKLFTDMSTSTMDPTEASNCLAELPQELAIELASRYIGGEERIQLLEDGKVQHGVKCHYHRHEDGQTCGE